MKSATRTGKLLCSPRPTARSLATMGDAVMVGRALALQGEPEFFVGQQIGGNEAVAMMRDKGTRPQGVWLGRVLTSAA